MVSLRTLEGKKKYQEYLKAENPSGACSLCEKNPLKIFKYWKVVENSFPYDQIAKVHHMIMPMRHVLEDKLWAEELEELRQIKNVFINAEYDWIIEATYKNKSIPNHFHLHLIVGKERTQAASVE
jgi:hypothetical protein